MTGMNRRQMVKIGAAASSLGICMGVKPSAAGTLMRLSLPANANLATVAMNKGINDIQNGLTCGGNQYEYEEIQECEAQSSEYYIDDVSQDNLDEGFVDQMFDPNGNPVGGDIVSYCQ